MNRRRNILSSALMLIMASLILCPGITQAGLLDTHKQALGVYHSDKDPAKSLSLLEAAGAQSFVLAKPGELSDAQYVSFLNDYGFFLAETSDRWQEAIPILEKVIVLNPNRHAAHLNLGDAYAKASAASTDPARQADLDRQVRSHYEDYARLIGTKKNTTPLPERVHAVLNRVKDVTAPRAPSQPSQSSSAREEPNPTGLQLQSTIKNIGIEMPIAFDGQHVIFSRYDKTGNGKELVFLNSRTGTIDQTFGGLGTLHNHYLYSDKNFVITRDIGEPHRLTIFDRTTARRIREIKLSQRIAGAFIRAGTLYVTQNNNRYHLSEGGQGLTYDLQTGKLLGNTGIIPSNITLLYGDQIILIGYEVRTYDFAFQELGNFPKPPKSRELNGNCELGPAKIAGDKLLVGANCGDIAIYDLKKRTLERTIPAFDPALFNSFDVVGDLLFVAPEPRDMGHSPNKGRIFALQTGQEKAVLDIATHFLSIDGDMLITLPQYKWGAGASNTLAIYRMQQDLLVATDTRLKKLLDAHENAKVFAASHDSYRALDLLEEAGFPAALKSDGMEGLLQPIAKDYVRWLADTFHRFDEAIPLIAQFRGKYPNEASWALLRSDVLRKQYEIGGNKTAWDQSIAAYQEYQHLSGGASETQRREFARDKQVITSSDVREVNIVGGDLVNSIFFHEERAYIGRFGCFQSQDGVSLEVFDRQTFQHLKTIKIAECDDDYQDSIGNIRFTPTQILLDIAYRYESEDRPNLAVIDKTALAILGKMRRDGGREREGQSEFRIPVLARNERYEVMKIGNYGAQQLRVKSLADGAEWDIDWPPLDPRQPLLLPNDKVFIAEGTRFSIYDFKSRQRITITQLPPSLKYSPVVAAHGSLIFVGFGHDLLILDTFNSRIAHYERNFISQGFADNGHGVDLNKIDFMAADGDRLIVRTFDGNHSRILNLTALKKSLGFPTDTVRLQFNGTPSYTVNRLESQVITPEEDIPLPTAATGSRPANSPTLVQPEYVQALARIAEVEAGVGNMQESKETLRKAWSAAQTLLNPREQLGAYVTLARTMVTLKDTDLALTVIEGVEHAIKQMSVASSLTTLPTWPKLAQVYALLPDDRYRTRASAWISRTRESLSAATDEEKIAILLRIAEVEHSLGHRQAAIETLRGSLKWLPANSPLLETHVLNLLDISTIQATLEGKGVAANTLRQAFEAARGISSKTTRVQMYAAIAAAQARLDEKTSAQQSLAEAQKVGATIKKDSNQDRVAAAIAKAKAALQRFDESEQLLASNHTGTWGYQNAFEEVAKEEARAGDADRAIRMALRYSTLSESEKVHLVNNLAELLLIALDAGVPKKEVAANLTKIVYKQLASLKPFQ